MVREDQRRRLIGAVATALADNGYAQLTVQQIVSAAHVSRRTFYEHFDNTQDALVSAHDDAAERLVAAIARDCRRLGEWPSQVRAALAATLGFAASEPHLAQLLTFNAVAFEPPLATRVDDSHERFAAMLRSGRDHYPEAASLPKLTERFLVGGVLAIVAKGIAKGEHRGLPKLEPHLLKLILLPYLGSAEARRIAMPSAES